MTVKSAAAKGEPAPPDRSGDIVIAACRAIARIGVRDFSMREVAEEAGVSKALIHYYFASRNDLLAAAYEFADHRARERVRSEVEGVESGATRLTRLLDLYLGDEASHREDWILWSELSSTAIFEEKLRPVMEATFARWSSWIDSLVRDAIDEGSIASPVDADDIALRIIGLTEGLGLLVTRDLISREAARVVLEHHLRETFAASSDRAAIEKDGRPAEPVATGYLRLLAQLVRDAVEELRGLASDPEEKKAIDVVAALIEARAINGRGGRHSPSNPRR